MTAYYNEIDKNAAAWLRELIKAGLIADGEVDERSIEDVKPSDLDGFTQCHFFAGIGVWSYSLRCAGWPDDRPIWTGSCPCQPFSAAGERKGFADERHLWPAFHHLISQCHPDIIIGEQVASKDGLTWFDLVQIDMEAAGYACGAVDTCAAGFGAPHIRQRLYWVAYSEQFGRRGGRTSNDSRQAREIQTEGHGTSCGVAHTMQSGRATWRPEPGIRQTAGGCVPCRLADAIPEGLQGGDSSGKNSPWETIDRLSGCGSTTNRPGPTNGFWRDADWLWCRDGKWRPVESGTSALAARSAAHVVKLRGYGNAICAPQAQAFIEAVMDII